MEPRIDYGGVMLTLSDALNADKLDRQFRFRPDWSHLNTFDPADVPRLFAQDARYAESGLLPDIYAGWYCDLAVGVTQPRWAGSDEAFARYARAMRDALLLPLEFSAQLRDLWETWGLAEAERRIKDKERRVKRAIEYGNPSWETADLVAEVEEVCGDGRKEGRQVVFRCPLPSHGGGDVHPSLKVDPVKRTWYCWPCAKGGGVVAWRRANGR